MNVWLGQVARTIVDPLGVHAGHNPIFTILIYHIRGNTRPVIGFTCALPRAGSVTLASRSARLIISTMLKRNAKVNFIDLVVSLVSLRRVTTDSSSTFLFSRNWAPPLTVGVNQTLGKIWYLSQKFTDIYIFWKYISRNLWYFL